MSDAKVTAQLVASILAAGKESIVTEKVRQEVLEATGTDLANYMKIVPDREAALDAGTILACMRVEPDQELVLPDNKTGPCAWGCGHTIQFRPHWPDNVVKACLQCIDARPIKENKDGEIRLTIQRARHQRLA